MGDNLQIHDLPYPIGPQNGPSGPQIEQRFLYTQTRLMGLESACIDP